VRRQQTADQDKPDRFAEARDFVVGADVLKPKQLSHHQR
jgi:hypothetical protein